MLAAVQLPQFDFSSHNQYFHAQNIFYQFSPNSAINSLTSGTSPADFP